MTYVASFIRAWIFVYRGLLTDLQRAPASGVGWRNGDDRGAFKGHGAILRVAFTKQLDGRSMAGLLGVQQRRPAANHHPAEPGPVLSVVVNYQCRFAGLLDVPHPLQSLPRLLRLVIDRCVEAGAV